MLAFVFVCRDFISPHIKETKYAAYILIKGSIVIVLNLFCTYQITENNTIDNTRLKNHICLFQLDFIEKNRPNEANKYRGREIKRESIQDLKS